MVYRQTHFSASLEIFPKRAIPGFESAGYLEARRFLRARGLEMASHKVLEEHIDRCPGYGPVWEREIVAYPESGRTLRMNRDVTDVNGWVLPGRYVPEEADQARGIALVIDPAEIEEHRSRTVIHPRSLTMLRGFPESDRSDDHRMPLDFFNDSGAAGRNIFRYYGGGVRPILRRIYGGMKNLSVDYAPSAPFAIAAEVPLRADSSQSPPLPWR